MKFLANHLFVCLALFSGASFEISAYSAENSRNDLKSSVLSELQDTLAKNMSWSQEMFGNPDQKFDIRECVLLKNGQRTTWREAVSQQVTSEIVAFEDMSYIFEVVSSSREADLLRSHKQANLFFELSDLFHYPNYSSEIDIVFEVSKIMMSNNQTMVLEAVKNFSSYLKNINCKHSNFQSARFLSLINIFYPEVVESQLDKIRIENLNDAELNSVALAGLICSEDSEKYTGQLTTLIENGDIPFADLQEYLCELETAGIPPQNIYRIKALLDGTDCQ